MERPHPNLGDLFLGLGIRRVLKLDAGRRAGLHAKVAGDAGFRIEKKRPAEFLVRHQFFRGIMDGDGGLKQVLQSDGHSLEEGPGGGEYSPKIGDHER